MWQATATLSALWHSMVGSYMSLGDATEPEVASPTSDVETAARHVTLIDDELASIRDSKGFSFQNACSSFNCFDCLNITSSP